MIAQLLLPLQSKDKLFWTNFNGNSLSLALFMAAERSDGPLLVIAEDNLAASLLQAQLAFFNKAQKIWINVFPDWETLPYDNFSPHPDIISDRLAILSQLSLLKKGILIVPVATLMHRLPPRSFLESQTFLMKKGELFDVAKMRERLERYGYRCVNQVYAHGEFAVRGSIFDLYPMGGDFPYRIDLFDNEIDTIRTFDPESQRSNEQVTEINILPAHEFPFDEKAISLFRQNWRLKFEGNPLNASIYQEVSQGITPTGIEYYFPLFFSETSTLFDYFSEKNILFYSDKINGLAEHFWQEIKERYDQLRYDITRPLLPPVDIFIPPQDLFARIHDFPEIQILANTEKTTAYHFPSQPLPTLTVNPRLTQPWQALVNFIAEYPTRVLFCAETEGRATIFNETLIALGIHAEAIETWAQFLDSNARFVITAAAFDRGFWLTEPDVLVISEAYLLGQPALKQKRAKGSQVDADAIIRNLSELRIGSPVVHLAHGVGRYLGLQTLKINEIESEFLTLEYGGGDKLYVPVAALNMISRYSGLDADHAPIHRLGNDQWQKAKKKAKAQIRDVAAELLQVYATRAAKLGFVFKKPGAEYEAFAQSFPFDETDDQAQAIENVIDDMTSTRAMDRLICGDVGFGKTEVAMRAAFLATQSHKQVAVLVPTTLLAQQHYESFQDRFAGWPVNIEVLSRFRSAKQQDVALNKVKMGGVDILIGTHRLLQKDIEFKNLGVVIIDEEHRFGVQQKDKLKKLRAEVDILTLTATPIPRTLNMSLAGIRDLSIIATPPAKRLSIKTFVREKNHAIIREAILREIYRGGQVYFLHNKVETIEATLLELQRLVPEANIGVAHGQMHERELERITQDFYHRRFNVLICTTIIETGIDIPTANTIIIERADRFGLAQLHQLRGRVGRSHHQAYAYLLVTSFKGVSSEGKKRLDAISALEDLGAGFTLATHDLEIRGAGELLGEEQSGNMEEIGFSLYMELLDKAVAALKAGKDPALEMEGDEQVEIDLQIPALLPDIYIPDVNGRLILYKRIASAATTDALKELQIELIDRFGLLPDVTKNLFEITALKLIAQNLGIKRIEAFAKGGRIEFGEKPCINVDKLLKKISLNPGKLNFEGPQRVRFSYEQKTSEQRIQFIRALLEEIA